MMGEMVLGIFAASVATVSLPAMSRLVEAGDQPGTARQPGRGPARHRRAGDPRGGGHGRAGHAPIIALIFQTGRYGAEAVSLDRPHGGVPGGGPAVHRHRADRRPVPVRPQGLPAAGLRRPAGHGGERGRLDRPHGPPGHRRHRPGQRRGQPGRGGVPGPSALRRRMPSLPYREVLGGWAVDGRGGRDPWASWPGPGPAGWTWAGSTGSGGTSLRLFPLIAGCALAYGAPAGRLPAARGGRPSRPRSCAAPAPASGADGGALRRRPVTATAGEAGSDLPAAHTP